MKLYSKNIKNLVYSSLTIILSAGIFLSIYMIDYSIKSLTGFNSLWVTVPAIFFLALMFQPLSNSLQQIVDRTFFKTNYEADNIARKFSENIKKLMKKEDLAEYISRSAFKTFKLFGTACFMYDEDTKKYTCMDARGTLSDLMGTTLTSNYSFIEEMNFSGKIILLEELDYVLGSAHKFVKNWLSNKDTIKKIYQDLKGLKAHISVPCISKKRENKLVGFLLCDRKKSEDPFTREDMNLLETISNQTAISIENALMYKSQIDTIEKSMKLEKLADLGKATAGVAREAQKALFYIDDFAKNLPEKRYDKGFLEERSGTLFTEVEKMRLLMQGVLEFSRPAPLRMEPLVLNTIVDDIIMLVDDMAKKKGITIEKDCNEEINIESDRNSLKQILINLMMNAVEATPEGGKVTVGAQKKDGKIEIYVADTGPGIPDEMKEKIFEPFFTTKKDGVGLGLTIVRNTTKQLKGVIKIINIEESKILIQID